MTDPKPPLSNEPLSVCRSTLEAVAKTYNDLEKLRQEQRDTMALMVKLCIMRIESPDSRKRKEGIAGLKDFLALLENKA